VVIGSFRGKICKLWHKVGYGVTSGNLMVISLHCIILLTLGNLALVDFIY
jgi:hypothetical protein